MLFEAPLAAGLLGNFVQAVSGGALCKNGFCSTRWASRCFPEHIDISEDVHPRRQGGSPFDEEGVRVQARQVVETGRACRGYFLSSYSAQTGHENHGQRGRLAQPAPQFAP